MTQTQDFKMFIFWDRKLNVINQVYLEQSLIGLKMDEISLIAGSMVKGVMTS